MLDWESCCAGDPVVDLAQSCIPFVPVPVERLGENTELAEVVASELEVVCIHCVCVHTCVCVCVCVCAHIRTPCTCTSYVRYILCFGQILLHCYPSFL